MHRKSCCVFIGGIPHKDEISHIHRQSIIQPQFAAERFQKEIYSYLKEIGFDEKVFLSLPYTGLWKIHTNLKYYCPCRSSVSDFKYFSFSTFPFLYSISRGVQVFRALKKIYNSKNKGVRCTFIFVYAVHLPFLVSAVIFRRMNTENVRVVLISPDLPEYTSSRFGFLGFTTRLVKSFLNRILYYFSKKCDGHITFTDSIAAVIKKPSSPSFTLLGLPPSFDCLSSTDSSAKYYFSKKYSCYRVIFYGGGLSDRYGVNSLVDAFVDVAKEHGDVKLILCGRGDSVEYIESMSVNCPQIEYLGTLENSVLLEIQKSASVLVNPRPSTEKFVKFSFPSKMLEYASTGIPIVGYNLPTYPEELVNAMIIPKGDTKKDLVEAINSALTLTSTQRKEKEVLSKIFLEKYCSNDAVMHGLKKLVSDTLKV
jgi:glycosyltransferase involved in cell wall biosynthesis